MQTKLFQLLDRATFIPLLCIKPGAPTVHEFEAKMAWRYGYLDNPAVIVLSMSQPSRGCESDPFAWGDRTFQTAHQYIRDNWDTLNSGDVIDVEFILGEKAEPGPGEA